MGKKKGTLGQDQLHPLFRHCRRKNVPLQSSSWHRELENRPVR